MKAARAASVLLWIVALGWGLPGLWLLWWLIYRGRLPMLPLIGIPNAGPFYHSVSTPVFGVLLAGSVVLGLAQAKVAALLWANKRSGAVLQFVLLPFESVLWYGFALPIPPVLALVRMVLTAKAWPGLQPARPRGQPADG